MESKFFTCPIFFTLVAPAFFDEIEKNPVRCPDPSKALEMVSVIESARKEGDSVGGVIETVVKGCPVGLGDPCFDKLEALLSHAIMSIGTVKGIEFGDGFAATLKRGSENNDAFTIENGKVKTKTNAAGGTLGGISSGEDIIFRAAIKPTSSITKSQETVNMDGQGQSLEVHGRHDPCICPRAVPVLEAMTAITILDAFLVQKTLS